MFVVVDYIFCRKAADCFDYYNFNPDNHVAEVIAYGEVKEEGNKCCTNKLEIVRELSWHEVLDIVNTGRDYTGNRNKTNYSNGCFNTDWWDKLKDTDKKIILDIPNFDREIFKEITGIDVSFDFERRESKRREV